MTAWLLGLATHYGYLIVFLGVIAETTGVPVPGETSLLVGAVLAAQGRLDAVVVALVGFVAAFLGPNLGYALGRAYGERLLQLRLVRRVYGPRRVASAQRFFVRHGMGAVIAGRFVAFLRILTGPLAGIHRMPLWRFIVADAVGAAGWVAAVVAIGLLAGRNLGAATALVSRIGYAGLALVLAAAAGFVIWSVRRHR